MTSCVGSHHPCQGSAGNRSLFSQQPRPKQHVNRRSFLPSQAAQTHWCHHGSPEGNRSLTRPGRYICTCRVNTSLALKVEHLLASLATFMPLVMRKPPLEGLAVGPASRARRSRAPTLHSLTWSSHVPNVFLTWSSRGPHKSHFAKCVEVNNLDGLSCLPPSEASTGFNKGLDQPSFPGWLTDQSDKRTARRKKPKEMI